MVSQVRLGHLKTNKTELLSGNLEASAILALAANGKGDALISGHEDGCICR